MKKVSKRRKELDRCKIPSFRVAPPVFEQVKQLAKREDRTVPYLLRRWIQQGLEAEMRGR